MQTPSFLAMLLFAFSVTAPIFVMVLLGVMLKRGRVIDDAFIGTGSRLVYGYGLPTLLFISSATSDFGAMADLRVLMAMGAMTLLMFALTQFSARWCVSQVRDQGVFVQGAFRGNLVIIGLAFCANAYGEKGLAIAALPVAITVILYNLLSVYTLHRSLSDTSLGSSQQLWRGIVRNPLIIAILAGLLVNALGFPLPKLLRDSANYLGQMVLPLALICIGGALNLKQLRRFDKAVFIASVWKLLLSPMIACGIAWALGVRDEAMAVLFFLAASPTATVSFVMVQALGGNGRLAANIIVQTTLVSLITVTLGLWLLQVGQLV